MKWLKAGWLKLLAGLTAIVGILWFLERLFLSDRRREIAKEIDENQDAIRDADQRQRDAKAVADHLDREAGEIREAIDQQLETGDIQHDDPTAPRAAVWNRRKRLRDADQ